MKLFVRFAALAACTLPLLATSRCVSETELPPFILPPATQTGANTFGFVLDGRVWRDYGTRCGLTTPCDSNKARVLYRDARSGNFNIYAGLTTKEHSEYFYLTLLGIKQAGTYPWLRSNSTRTGAELTFESNNGNTSYYGRPSAGNSLTITRLDTVRHIVSGVFNVVLREAIDTTKTSTITDGRFDFTYR